MSQNPSNPFDWRQRTAPSVFAQDAAFRPKGDRKRSASQVMADHMEALRQGGEMPNKLSNLSAKAAEIERRVLAYKQFGEYTRAGMPKKKPNKHEK